MTAAAIAMRDIATVLDGYLWRGINEKDIHRQMETVLRCGRPQPTSRIVQLERERVIFAGRLDFFVEVELLSDADLTDDDLVNFPDVVLEHDRTTTGRVRIAIEVKMKDSATKVERQAQRYALDPMIDGVAVVTTKRRLAAQIATPELGGKPFRVIVLRSL